MCYNTKCSQQATAFREVIPTSNIGANIKARREAKGWTQEILSEVTGIHRVTIAKYETTDRGMTLDSATRIAKALGCTIDDLQWEEEIE